MTSAYPNWEPLAGDLVLDEGHQQPITTAADGELAEIAQMPHESPWPVLLGLGLALVFALLVVEKFLVAGIALGLCALVLAAWHR